jgi:hypothetical protein
MIKVLPPTLPAAQTLLGDMAVTPYRRLVPVTPLGPLTRVQLAPFHLMIRSSESMLPTAHTSFGPATVMPKSLLKPVPRPDIGTRDQAVPFQRMLSACESPNRVPV